MKPSIKNLWKASPPILKRIGAALDATFSGAAIGTILMDYKWVAISFIVLGVIGKFIVNLYRDPDVIYIKPDYDPEKEN